MNARSILSAHRYRVLVAVLALLLLTGVPAAPAAPVPIKNGARYAPNSEIAFPCDTLSARFPDVSPPWSWDEIVYDHTYRVASIKDMSTDLYIWECGAFGGPFGNSDHGPAVYHASNSGSYRYEIGRFRSQWAFDVPHGSNCQGQPTTGCDQLNYVFAGPQFGYTESETGTFAVGPLTAAFTFKAASDRIADFGKVDFDASGSLVPSDTPVTYHWDWGDGSSAAVGSPLVRPADYRRGGDYRVAMHFADRSGNVSNTAVQTVPLCPRQVIAAPLPPVDISFTDLAKVVRVKYGPLPLTLSYVPPASDATCSFTGSGTLPVTIGLGPAVAGLSIPLTSVASARLDFLRPGEGSVPACGWVAPRSPVFNGSSRVGRDCLVGGAGDTLVRWHTDGFSERLRNVELFNSGPLTYYARVSSNATYTEAIAAVERLVHVELSTNLGWISPLYLIQEPPASLGVVDPVGRITGVPNAGRRPVNQIPSSAYVSDGRGYSAVALLRPDEHLHYTARISGTPGSRFSMSSTVIVPALAAQHARDSRTAGKIGRDGIESVQLGDRSNPLAALSISPAIMKPRAKGGSIGKAGALVAYRLKSAANVKFFVERRTRRGFRRMAGQFSVAGHAGANRLRFTGRIAGRALADGRYRLVGVATERGLWPSRSASHDFRVR